VEGGGREGEGKYLRYIQDDSLIRSGGFRIISLDWRGNSGNGQEAAGKTENHL